MIEPLPALPLICVPDAIPRDQRASHFRLAERLFQELSDARRDLSDGYAFRFPASHYDEVAHFVANERLCCPAIAFEITAMPGAGPVWLTMRGPAGAREFLAAELPLGAGRAAA